MKLRAVVCLCLIALATCLAAAAGAVAGPAGAVAGPVATTEGTLVFGTGNAHMVGGQVAVPVECLGGGRDLCSGVVTLSHGGHHSSEPFSVQGGRREVLFVPLRLGKATKKMQKVRGIAATDQGLGGPTRTKALIYVG